MQTVNIDVTTRRRDLRGLVVAPSLTQLWQESHELKRLAQYAKLNKFEAKPGQTLIEPRLILDLWMATLIHAGLGTADGLKADLNAVWRKMARAAFSQVSKLNTAEALLSLSFCQGLEELIGPHAYELGRRLAIEAVRGGYFYTGKSQAGGFTPDEHLARLIVDASALPSDAMADFERGIAHGKYLGESIGFARDMVNDPPNIATPGYLVEQALKVQREFPSVEVTILDRAECEAIGMGAFLAVAQGGGEAYVIMMEYHPGHALSDGKVCVAGKGLCFDTGGYNLKPGDSMRDMQIDMGGAANMIATMRMAAALNLPINVTGIAGCCQNLVSASAWLPGSRIKSMSGIEILVDNTDAEGRVVMADMIWSAINRRRCTKVIEMSTLTGACLVALGKKTAGLFANDDALAAVLEDSSKRTGESIWRLPVTDDHKKQIESQFGDVVNTGGRFAGASTAAAFLFKFAGDTPFVHLDIAGPVWDDQATGFGVELVTDAIESLARAA